MSSDNLDNSRAIKIEKPSSSSVTHSCELKFCCLKNLRCRHSLLPQTSRMNRDLESNFILQIKIYGIPLSIISLSSLNPQNDVATF